MHYRFVFRVMGRNKRIKTRGSYFFGAPQPIPADGSLPTLGDVVRAAYYEKELNETLSDCQAAVAITPQVFKKWSENNPELKTISENALKVKINRVLKDVKKILLHTLSTAQKKSFLSKLNKLFDILICRCPIVICDSQCGKQNCCGLHVDCSKCDKSDRIPDMELSFILDQRNKVGHHGELQMSSIDTKEAKRQRKLNVRRSAAERALEKHKQNTDLPPVNEEDFNVSITEDNNDPDFTQPSQREATGQRNTVKLKQFVAEVDRYRISNRAAAALWNSALTCAGIITEENRELVVTATRIHSQRNVHRAEVQAAKQSALRDNGGLVCVGVDGKRDRHTKVLIDEVYNGEVITKQKSQVEEHQTYTVEPAGTYLTHSAIPKDKGTGRDLAEDFLDVLGEYDSKESILAILCDSTATNTGWKTGLFVSVERALKSPLTLLACFLHLNELPFRHVFVLCDDGMGTSGPNSFKGVIGTSIQGEIHTEPVIKYESISSELPGLADTVRVKLSRDQRLLYDYTAAIRDGVVPAKLARQKPGEICHARWLTLALRLMIKYTRTESPSTGLKNIVLYIVQVYSPMWFAIKKAKTFTEGPDLMLKWMKLANNLPAEIKETARTFIQSNAYFCEPTTLLAGMLSSDNKELREFASKTLLKVRKRPAKPPKMKLLQGIRKFEIPDLCWEAERLDEIIDWSKVKIGEPRLLRQLSDEELQAAVEVPHVFPVMPLHSQSVERAVKIVSEVCESVFGEKAQREMIASITKCRTDRPAFNAKKDYVVQ